MSAATSGFGEVPYSALQSLARRIDGNAGNGRPLSELFSSFGPDAADKASVALLSGMTTGPVAVASDLSGVLGTSRSHALTIARTELLGSYRDAQLQNYRANSDVVGEWMWSADKASACIACLEMDGETFPLDQDMIEHVCGKCSPLPVTKGWDSILGPLGIDTSDIADTSITASYQSGHDWFLEQDDATQLSILGPAKYNAWTQGDITLDDLAGRRDDGAWGGSIYEKSLKEIGLNARDYLPSTARRPGLGPHGPEAVAGAREASPPASAEPIKVALPGGGYTWIVPGDEHQFDAGGNLDVAKRAKGWQGIGEELGKLRNQSQQHQRPHERNTNQRHQRHQSKRR